jgi:hypothetical protein
MKYREILEQVITEINMSPGVLLRLASDINAQAGMEFEMIVPGAAEEDDGDMEPDYDSDESVRSIQDAYDFFYDGDYNGRRDVESLRDSMQSDYQDWLGDQINDRWEADKEEVIYDWLRYNAAPSEVFGILGVEEDENGNFPDPEKKDYAAAADKVAEEQISPWYEDAEEDFRDNFYRDSDLESEWLEHEGLENMSDIENRYQISWPHWQSMNQGGDIDIEQVADEFGSAIGRPVNYSRNYHGAKRTTDGYSLEPDGSLDADDPGDGGLEFISPPLPITEMFSDLQKVIKWAKQTGCYTNDSTGLHINVSVPGWDGDSSKLDYVKLAVLLGDEYVLEEFGRSGNTYCKSALKIVKDHIRQRPEDATALLEKMKSHLNTAAAKVIHSGTTSKYTSINNKNGYIEFRSPGGDWLNAGTDKIESTLLRFVVALDAAVDESKYKQEYAKKLYKLLAPSNDSSDTLQYFAKFSAGELPKSALTSFVRQAQLQRKLKKGPTGAEYWWSVGRPGYFASVEVVAKSKEEAIEKGLAEYPDWRTARDVTAKPLRPYDTSSVKATVGEPQSAGSIGQQQYEIYDRTTGRAVEQYAAADDEAALIFLDDYRRMGPHSLSFADATERFSARVVSRNRQSASNTTTQTDMENRLGWGSQSADANYEIVYRASPTPQRRFVFIANTPQEAQRKYTDWLAAQGLPPETEDYGFREIARPGSTLDIQRQRVSAGDFTGQWKVMIDGEEVYRFGGAGNNQGDANRIAREWITQQIRRGTLNPAEGADITVVPVMQ